MRFVGFCLILLALMFAGHSLYSRAQINKMLGRSLEEMNYSPGRAIESFKPIMGMSRIVALGKVGEAETTFLTNLERTVLSGLNEPAPTQESFRRASQGMGALKLIMQKSGIDTRERQKKIALAAKEAVPRLQQQGTLRAWDEMMEFFTELHDQGDLPEGVITNYDEWLAQMQAVPRRPMGVRDTLQRAGSSMASALNLLGLTPSTGPGQMLAPAPAPLSDQQLIEADRMFAAGVQDLNLFPPTFHEQALPPELLGAQARLLFNLGSLKLAHVQDRGAMLGSMASGFMAHLLIRTDTTVVPTPGEMIGAFLQGAQGDFDQAARLFANASDLTDGQKRACMALCEWSKGLLLAESNRNEAARCMQLATNMVRPPAQADEAIVKAMQSGRRALIFVQTP